MYRLYGAQISDDAPQDDCLHHDEYCALYHRRLHLQFLLPLQILLCLSIVHCQEFGND